MKDTIRELVEAFGPSGHEAAVRAIIRKQLGDAVDEVRTDALGSLIAVKRGPENAKRIMLAAHMDEIGLIASYIDKKGFVRVNPIGGVRTLFEVSGRVRFENGTVGVIGIEKLDGNQAPPFDKMFVDVGAPDRDSCPVQVGDAACFLQPMIEMNGLLASKAMDDRIGCAVLVETARKIRKSPFELYFVFTSQEEVGTRGAVTSAFGIAPDAALAVDVTLTGDTPEPPRKMAVALNHGPAIKIKDGGMLATPWIKDWMIRTAREHALPWQPEVLVGGTTDARAIQTTREGIPAGCLSIPCRYVHSPSEVVSYEDVRQSVNLLAAMLEGPAPEALQA